MLEAPELAVPAEADAIFKLNAVRAEKGLAIPGFGTVLNAYYYEVTPPGQTQPLSYPNRLMAPTFVSNRGQTLLIDLTSSLPNETNLHLHGFQGSAKQSGGRFGDCVFPVLGVTKLGLFDAALPKEQLTTDPCNETQNPAMLSIPRGGQLRYAYRIDTMRSGHPHPRGTLWYHAHPHGKAEGQIAGGLSGLAIIGDPRREYSHALAGLDEAQIRVRTLALKDMKVVRRGPDEAFRFLEFQSNKTQETYKDLACALDDTLAPKDSEGSSCRLELDNPEDVGGAKEGRWLFTVNGMAYPQVQVGEGGSEIWRIANMSANVTYRLRLVEDDGTKLRMQVLWRNGVAQSMLDPAQQWSQEIVMMPGSRADVLINYCAGRSDVAPLAGQCRTPLAAAKHAVLWTAGAATGLASEPKPPNQTAGAAAAADEPGDVWPGMQLLDVVFEGGKPAKRVARPPVSQAPVTKEPVATALQMAAASAAATVIPDAVTTAAALRPACTPPPDDYMADAVRVIRFNNFKLAKGGATKAGEEVFGIFSDTMRVGATPPQLILETELAKLPLAAYQSFRMDMPPVCVRQGRHERWLVVNDSEECHNFHLHQLQFGVLGYRLDPSLRAATANTQCLGTGFPGAVAGRAVLSNDPRPSQDSFPLPPGSAILIDIDFTRPETVGRYLFHCHIVEHEDKGMAALLEVVDTAMRRSAVSPAATTALASNTRPTGGEFRLTSQTGKPFDSRSLAGKPYAIFFGYTNCPSLCPTTLLELTNALAALGAEASKLETLFVSIDPDHDGVERLRGYLAAFDPRIVGLTGNQVEIASVAHRYKAFYERVPGSAEPPVFDHTARVLLIDREGKLAGTLSTQETSASQLAKLRRLIGNEPML